MADEMQQDEEFEQFDGQNGSADNTEDNTENQTGGDDEDDGEEDERKVFVGGLSWETTTKDLREYFEKYGEVTNCTLKTDLETKKSRGFGFVVFSTTEAVDKVLAEKEHKLHGRNIDPKKANPRPVNKKVFVGRLDPAITEDDVRAYFETFGPVEKLELPFDKTKEQRRAFCFVEFKKLASMKKCLEQTNHKIGTQEVEVKKATPPGGGNPRGGPRGRGFGPGGRGGRGRGGFQGGYGYNQGGYGGYGGYGYGGYDQGYGYGGYGGDYGYNGGYGGYGGWNNGGYDQGYGYGYGGYDDWGYGQGGGQSNYGKAQKRGAGHGGYHPYNR